MTRTKVIPFPKDKRIVPKKVREFSALVAQAEPADKLDWMLLIGLGIMFLWAVQ